MHSPQLSSLIPSIAKGQAALIDFDAEKAVRYLQHAQGIDPENASCKGLLGQALLMLGRHRQAQTVLTEAIRLDPEQAPFYVALGWACVLQNNVDGAHGSFHQTVRIDPEEAEGYAGIALTSLAQNNIVEAEAAVEKSLHINPDGITANSIKARIAELRQEPARAQEIIQQVLKASHFGPFGQTNQEVIERAKSSAPVKRITNKFARLEKMRARKR